MQTSSTIGNLEHLGCEIADATDLQQIAFWTEGITT